MPVELERNIFVVSQDDRFAKQYLEKVLINKWGWQPDTFSIFSIYDLDGTELPRTQHNDYLGYLYTTRAAMSKVLCGPEYAASYIGEWWSGFTSQLLARALADGPFANNYTIQLYGPAKPVNIFKFNYIEQMQALKMRPPPWVHIIGYSERICKGTTQCTTTQEGLWR